MNKSTLNGFALGNLTGLVAAFVLFATLPDDWWRFGPEEESMEELPQFIMLDFQRQLEALQNQVREKNRELKALRQPLEGKESAPEVRVPFIINGEDRTEEYAARFREQRAERVHSLVKELTAALNLNRRLQEMLRQTASEELSKPGVHPYQPVSLGAGSAVRRQLESHLSPAQIEELEKHVLRQDERRCDERARAWWLQVESVIELDTERRTLVRERLRAHAGRPDFDSPAENPLPPRIPLEAISDLLSQTELEKLQMTADRHEA